MRYNTTIEYGDVPVEVLSVISGGNNFTENNEERDQLEVKAFTYVRATINLGNVGIYNN